MTEILHLSTFLRRPIFDQDGDRIGRVQDLVARLGDDAHPPVVGVVVRIEGRNLFIPIRKVGGLAEGRMTFQGKRVDLRRFERRPGEMLLAEDLLARHLINLVRGRLIIANEIEIAQIDGRWEVVGVDPGRRSLLRRVLGQKVGQRVKTEAIVDFASIEPFVSHVPTARLRIPYRKLARLHPAQIADLVEQASHEEGEEIIEAVAADRELEADVFEELDTEHQQEFLESRTDEEAARLLATMEPDDAADLLVDLDQERRIPVLEALPPEQQRKIRALLSYSPETAGGLMSPNFLLLERTKTVEEALAAIRQSEIPPEALSTIYVGDESGALVGTVSVVRLLKAGLAARLGDVAEGDPVMMRVDADRHEIQRKMTDFDLAATPVVDNEQKMIGLITVDDVLEMLLPTGWRRDFGMTSADN